MLQAVPIRVQSRQYTDFSTKKRGSTRDERKGSDAPNGSATTDRYRATRMKAPLESHLVGSLREASTSDARAHFVAISKVFISPIQRLAT